LYTGKEGKTAQGCPLAKWVIRRSSADEKLLLVVKNRRGHKCEHSWIVICIVLWEGVLSDEADFLYTMLSRKLNKCVIFDRTVTVLYQSVTFGSLAWGGTVGVV